MPTCAPEVWIGEIVGGGENGHAKNCARVGTGNSPGRQDRTRGIHQRIRVNECTLAIWRGGAVGFVTCAPAFQTLELPMRPDNDCKKKARRRASDERCPKDQTPPECRESQVGRAGPMAVFRLSDARDTTSSRALLLADRQRPIAVPSTRGSDTENEVAVSSDRASIVP
jgi:hypothetical protein